MPKWNSATWGQRKKARIGGGGGDGGGNLADSEVVQVEDVAERGIFPGEKENMKYQRGSGGGGGRRFDRSIYKSCPGVLP